MTLSKQDNLEPRTSYLIPLRHEVPTSHLMPLRHEVPPSHLMPLRHEVPTSHLMPLRHEVPPSHLMPPRHEVPPSYLIPTLIMELHLERLLHPAEGHRLARLFRWFKCHARKRVLACLRKARPCRGFLDNPDVVNTPVRIHTES